MNYEHSDGVTDESECSFLPQGIEFKHLDQQS